MVRGLWGGKCVSIYTFDFIGLALALQRGPGESHQSGRETCEEYSLHTIYSPRVIRTLL